MLTNLNTRISDATLDDSGDPRTPTAHNHVEADITDLDHLIESEINLANLGEKNHASLASVSADQHNDTKVRSKVVDESAIADNKILVYKSASDTLVYESKPTGGSGAPSEMGIETTDGSGVVTVTLSGSYTNKPVVMLTPEFAHGTDVVTVQIDGWTGPPYTAFVIHSGDDSGKSEPGVDVHWLLWTRD